MILNCRRLVCATFLLSLILVSAQRSQAQNDTEGGSLIPRLTSKVFSLGSWLYTYDVSLSATSAVQAGAMVPDSLSSDKSLFVTLFDVEGYLGGTASIAYSYGGSWTLTTPTIGKMWPKTSVPDNAGTVNIVATYTDTVTRLEGLIDPILTIQFRSKYGTTKRGYYAGQDLKKADNTRQNNSGRISIATVPEPAFYQMGSLVALGALGLLRIRKRKV